MPQQQKQPDRPHGAPIFPFALAAIAIAVAMVACDRPGTRAAAPASEKLAAQTSVPAAEQPRDARTFENTAGGASSAPRYASADAVSDTVISGKIKAAVLTDPGMTGADVSVNTDHGAVTLTGRVKSQEQTAIASAHAQRQDGVMRVDNHLSVEPQ